MMRQLLVFLPALFLAASAQAQDVLPHPEEAFPGPVGRTAEDSPPAHWPSLPEAPKGAPNVIVILTDDVGFGASSTFGGPVPTPSFEALAKNGLRYNEFHVTALCAPTRAALLTGRNNHDVGVALTEESVAGYEGYTGMVPKSAGTVAEILKQNGYNTAQFGKWHLTPYTEMGPTGPFTHWPVNMGFEYSYGFLAAETSQWQPALVEDLHPVEPPHDDPTYILDRDLADHAIAWIRQQKALAPNKPFFVYYAPGTSHAPHHAPKDWIAKFKGKFDQGWDKVREETFARQKQLHIIPPDTKLPPRPAQIPAWDSLTPDQKTVYAHMMEVYAAALSHADYQIGRMIDVVRDMGALDNTLVIYIQGDNGASAEGGMNGLMNEVHLFNGLPEDFNYVRDHLDDLGGPKASNHYPAGWAYAMNTPFQWFKQIASHFGGTQDGIVVSWPARIKDKGGLRSQFHHVIDIAPTILEAAGITAPSMLNGVPQKPLMDVVRQVMSGAPQMPSPIDGATKFTFYPGMTRIPDAAAPGLKNRSFTLSADLEMPADGAEGVLLTEGDRFGGLSFYLLKGKPVFCYNMAEFVRTTIAAPDRVPAGRHTVTADFKYDGGGRGKGGTVTLSVDGKPVASGHVEQTIANRFALDASMSVGEGTGLPVSDDYRTPFKFSGTLDQLVVTLK